jgi:hypothetical protein
VIRPLAFALALLAASAAHAAEFYVDPVSGSNGGNGSAADPWRTLQAVIDADLIQTRNWSSFPYQPGATLVTVNPGAPVRAGDTIWLRSGYHGVVSIQGAYNASPITVAAQSGHTPGLRSLMVRSAQNWIFRGLSISPSHAPPLSQIDIVEIADHNFFGPAWDIEIHDSDIFTVADASSWSANDWVNVASSGIDVSADRVTVRGCKVRNVRFGIGVSGVDAKIQENLIDGFSADGMRGLGDNGLFEYNQVQNNLVEDPPDPNHDDGFQSWSVGPGGVGTGEVRGVVLRGNTFINHVNPNHPLRSSMQAIGCFDGFFVNWVVENNVVITDHWHGITFLGMRDSRIVNNTVIDIDSSSPGPPWIMVNPHKDGRPSQNVVVRNNIATDYAVEGTNVVSDHNTEFTMANAATLFVAPPYDLHLRPGTAVVDTGSATLAPALDIEKVPRPQGAAVDRGAYERFTPTLVVGDATVAEGNAGSTNLVFTLVVAPANPTTITVNYATASGTASAGSDYAAVSGVATFPPGITTRTVAVPVIGDPVDEDDETLFLNLSGAVNASIGDPQGLGTIQDDDPPPLIVIGDCAVTEGNAGTVLCALPVTLSSASSRTVTANFATSNGTATAGSDYTATSGGLTFTPGQATKTVDVTVAGDSSIEADEDFLVTLSALSNAAAGDLQGIGTIVDDDAPALPGQELLHGSSHWTTLAADPGPTADQDLYRLAQAPRASYEVVVDGVSGDVAPGIVVERLASDNATVLQSATPTGTGSSVSLRWENLVPATVAGQYIRVKSNGCGSDCGSDDVYRIQVYDTTYSIPRFNNAGSQVTVVVLQNRSNHTVAGRIHFWDGAGTLLHLEPFSLSARAQLALNTSGLLPLQGKGGAITISNDGQYGDLAGKAVSLEITTGFSFDSLLIPRKH